MAEQDTSQPSLPTPHEDDRNVELEQSPAPDPEEDGDPEDVPEAD
jgi:hypothetical protein